MGVEKKSFYIIGGNIKYYITSVKISMEIAQSHN